MNEKMKKLKEAMQEKLELSKKLLDEGKTEESTKAFNEFEDLQKQYSLAEKQYQVEKTAASNGSKEKEQKKETNESIKAFAAAARNGFKAMNEGTLVDGGYVVPEDISTIIQTLRSARRSLKDLVRVTPTTKKSGSRTFKKRAQHKGFSKVGEGAKIQGNATPQFERINYNIEKYAGYYPVTNELLEDTDQNIVDTLTEWIVEDGEATDNANILAALNDASKTEVDLKNLDGIQKAVLVDLGQAFIGTSCVVTNDDGLLYLSTLKDADGKYLVQLDPTNPQQKRLVIGAISLPLEIIPNSILATSAEGKMPIYIGDLKEAIELFDRKLITITTSTVAVVGELNAFEEDLSLFRAILREDVVSRDKDAYVRGYITKAAGE